MSAMNCIDVIVPQILPDTVEVAVHGTVHCGYRNHVGAAGVRRRVDFQSAPMEQFLVSEASATDTFACEWHACCYHDRRGAGTRGRL